MKWGLFAGMEAEVENVSKIDKEIQAGTGG